MNICVWVPSCVGCYVGFTTVGGLLEQASQGRVESPCDLNMVKEVLCSNPACNGVNVVLYAGQQCLRLSLLSYTKIVVPLLAFDVGINWLAASRLVRCELAKTVSATAHRMWLINDEDLPFK